MSNNLFSLLAVKRDELETGIVLGKTRNGINVRIGSREMVLPSAVSDNLAQGTKVVIGKAQGKSYIIAREKSFSENILEVTVDG